VSGLGGLGGGAHGVR